MNSRIVNMLLQALRSGGAGAGGGQDGEDADDRGLNRYCKDDDEEDVWMDEDEEEERDEDEGEDKEDEKQGEIRRVDQQKLSNVAKTNINPTWKTHAHKHDNVRGISYIHQNLLAENQKHLKTVYDSKSSIADKDKSIDRKVQPNPLFKSSQNRDGLVSQTFIPNEISYTFEGICSRIYNSNFNHRGDMFLATSQIGTAMFDYLDDNRMRLNKTITCHNISWTLSDSDFTYDDKYMIHSTLSSKIQLFDVENKKYLSQLNVDDEGECDLNDDNHWYYGMRVYSAKISADGNEVIAGTSRVRGGPARIQVFDVPQNKIIRSIKAHNDDVNSVCFVDKLNSSLIISGSDDGLCKLWDTRTTNANNAVGIFYGHMSGMTNVESKEDNRYFISNCKDQSLKLWDIRKTTTEKKKVSFISYDYRMEALDPYSQSQIKDKMRQNKDDMSIKTFFGHQVRETLIRCHFSPKFTTDQRYIYTGSADSCVYIYDSYTGENIAKLKVEGGKLIRDCSWHPFSQNIITGDFAGNICRWEFIDKE